jgi:hypothetical protein
MPCDFGSGWEALTRQFYTWEIRGRGWQVWDRPVALEPPFRPFFGHFLSGPPDAIPDDGRKPTVLSSFFDRLAPQGGGPPPLPLPAEEEPAPHYIEDDAPILEIQVALPSDTKITKDAAGQFLVSLGHVSRPVSFEVVGTAELVIVQMACAESGRRQIREQLQAYFPEAILTERDGYLRALWDETGNRESAAVDFGLSKEFMRRSVCTNGSSLIPWPA